MAAQPHDPDDFTQDPDLFESDLTFGRAPIYAEEAGARHDKASAITFQPCAACGVPVMTGVTARGALIPVEPQTMTYTLLWQPKEPRPRLTPGRGYPVHQCRP
jgi:hypothetical protein